MIADTIILCRVQGSLDTKTVGSDCAILSALQKIIDHVGTGQQQCMNYPIDVSSKEDMRRAAKAMGVRTDYLVRHSWIPKRIVIHELVTSK